MVYLILRKRLFCENSRFRRKTNKISNFSTACPKIPILSKSKFILFLKRFSLDEKHLYTIQNPYKGKSFLSVWNLQQETLQPVKTIQLHEYPASGSCLSKEGINIGIGFIDGVKKIINLRYFLINS